MAWPSTLVRTKNWGTEVLTDTDLEGQFDLINTYVTDMMHQTTGHKHTGTANDGALINLNGANIGVTGELQETDGGTGLSAYTQGDIIYASASNTLSVLNKDTNSTRYLSNTGTSNNPSWDQVNIANGLKITSQAQGDIIYASSGSAWSRLGAGTSGQYLQTQGSGANPQWASVTTPGSTLKSTTTVSVASTTGSITLVSGKTYKIYAQGTFDVNGVDLSLRFNGDSGANYNYILGGFSNGADTTWARTTGATSIKLNKFSTAKNSGGFSLEMSFMVNNDSINNKSVNGSLWFFDNSPGLAYTVFGGSYTGSSTITSFELLPSSGNITTTVWTYELSGS